MTDQHILQTIKDIVADQLCIDPLEILYNYLIIEDLNADELDIAEIELRIEEEFCIENPPYIEINEGTTIGSLVEFVKSYLDSNSAFWGDQLSKLLQDFSNQISQLNFTLCKKDVSKKEIFLLAKKEIPRLVETLNMNFPESEVITFNKGD